MVDRRRRLIRRASGLEGLSGSCSREFGKEFAHPMAIDWPVLFLSMCMWLPGELDVVLKHSGIVARPLARVRQTAALSAGKFPTMTADDANGWRRFQFSGSASSQGQRKATQERILDAWAAAAAASTEPTRIDLHCSGWLGLVMARRWSRDVRRSADTHGLTFRAETRLKPRWVELSRTVHEPN